MEFKAGTCAHIFIPADSSVELRADCKLISLGMSAF